ncbi:MAG: 2-hydroxyglutaryl-CoA dehydratase [Dehalococcoidia bacterium]|nr:MAG: 2-hydroxyglutaryl-CoA dehydratase [Dehalococcoidia bacterium]
MKYYLGIDVGSVSTKLAVLDDGWQLAAHVCVPTHGEPVAAVKLGLKQIQGQLPAGISIERVAVTGSARELVGKMVGADIVKNEVTAQAASTLHYFPQARTVIEIGGQDSKIILLRDGLVADFGMNTVCAAGTGSFLDHQAQRLGLSLSEFGEMACGSVSPSKLAGRCTVFAESEMIHRQQSGGRLEDIVFGLCQTLVHNYLNSVAAGKEILPPVVFQGGLAFNHGMVRAFEDELKTEIIIPEHPELMGAVGAAILAGRQTAGKPTRFKGFNL